MEPCYGPVSDEHHIVSSLLCLAICAMYAYKSYICPKVPCSLSVMLISFPQDVCRMAVECRACVCIILKTEIITLWEIPASALMAFKRGVIDTSNKLSNWQGDDPCGDQWGGVICNSTNIATNVSRVTELYVFFSSTHESGL